ncbi:patatin-like phospholipase family protein [Raineyella sp. LH-20]|uniref:patatin-like phospholipase family protein n=1 Tax=Raineyella sp. LH-20 TaxID=3081204 RepID=UPI00295442D9|nr:patatin-like phospholipase family protein [Raineyella sp. LH-20]WOP18038.1 patatin-like phospholipase family protein [Raineyella sp. LH-20]
MATGIQNPATGNTSGTNVAIALGGGGARGYAHIGVLAELQDRGYRVTRIAGTSMGAIVGALYSSGHLDTFTDWVLELRTQREVLRLLDPNLRGPSTIKIDRVLQRVAEIIEVPRIEDLPIPFTAVAADLWTRREVWFQEGPINPAVRASIAIPGVFPPVVLNGRLLVDGGVLNQVPVSVLASAPADITLAVSLDGYEPHRGAALPVQTSADEQPEEEWTGRLRQTMGHLMEAEPLRTLASLMAGRGRNHLADSAPSVEDLFGEMPPGLRTTDVMTMSLETMQTIVQRYQLASFPPDVLVTVPRDSLGTLDFHRAEEQIALGRWLAAQAFDRAGMVSGDMSTT